MKTSLWLSIDPLAEKMPYASPYNYCLGNPVNLVDPDGRSPLNEYETDINTGKTRYVSNKGGDKIDYMNFIHNGKHEFTVSRSVTNYEANIHDREVNPYSFTERGYAFKKTTNHLLVSGGLTDPTLDIFAFVYGNKFLDIGIGAAWKGASGLFVKEAEVVVESGAQYTKSNLKLGQEMHAAYKLGEKGIKEFRLPSGKRIDFLDIKNGKIFELKPFNPRAMKAGENQLNMYLKELQSPATINKFPELNGIQWKKILDKY